VIFFEFMKLYLLKFKLSFSFHCYFSFQFFDFYFASMIFFSSMNIDLELMIKCCLILNRCDFNFKIYCRLMSIGSSLTSSSFFLLSFFLSFFLHSFLSLFSPDKRFTRAEVREHHDRDDCHMVIRGKVYSVHSFLEEHPGGDIIMTYAGDDATGENLLSS